MKPTVVGMDVLFNLEEMDVVWQEVQCHTSIYLPPQNLRLVSFEIRVIFKQLVSFRD